MRRKITLQPTRRKYFQEKNKIALEIDSGAAFGTGTHPTTSLCIDMIANYLKEGDSVLDVGTGTGILMVAAAKLGAAKILGIDRSRTATEIARKNLLSNGIDAGRFEIRKGNLGDGVDEQFNLVISNITTEVILVLLNDVQRVLAQNGIFICSGMLEGNTHHVVTKMKALGFEILETGVKEKWVAIAGKRKIQHRE